MGDQREGRDTEPQTEGEGKYTPSQKSQRREFHSPSTLTSEVMQATELIELRNQQVAKETQKPTEKEGLSEKYQGEEGQAAMQVQLTPPKKRQRTIFDYAGIRSHGGPTDPQPANEGSQSEVEGLGQYKKQKTWWQETQTELPRGSNEEEPPQRKIHHPMDREEDPKQ